MTDTHGYWPRAFPEPPPSPAPVDQVAWFERTGHCGGCGQPGNYCLCPRTRPCKCRDLHDMGSGLGEDALDQFAVVVDDAQESLF